MKKPSHRLFLLFTVTVIALQGVMWGCGVGMRNGGGAFYSGAWCLLIVLTMSFLYNWVMMRFSIESYNDKCRIQELEESLTTKRYIINESFDYMFAIGALDRNRMSPEIIDIVMHRLHEKREAYDLRVGQQKLPFEKEKCCSCCL